MALREAWEWTPDLVRGDKCASRVMRGVDPGSGAGVTVVVRHPGSPNVIPGPQMSFRALKCHSGPSNVIPGPHMSSRA
jgi:hypothetical protein